MKNKLRNKKGITLIALVITIIVLLILAGIAISMIAGNNGVLTKATDAKKANEQATEYERVGLAAQSALIDGEGTINLADATGTAKGSLKKALIEEFGSESPVVAGYTAGKVTIGDKKYSVSTTGLLTEIKWTWTDNQASGEGHGKISVGDLITSKKKTTEQFYVISVDGDNVAMLAKYNLKQDGGNWIQDTDGGVNSYIFCTGDEWTAAGITSTKDDINADFKGVGAVGIAESYASDTLGVDTGRLMIYEEANGLKTSNSTIIYGQYESGKYLNYWLGSAKYSGYYVVWEVRGEYSSLSVNSYSDNNYGVRPVIEISASSIQ